MPVRASVGAVHGGRGGGRKEHGDKTVEQTSSEGDDGHWDDLLTEVRLSLRVLGGPSITLKQTKDKLSQSAEIRGWRIKPAERLRQNEREDAGDEEENDKKGCSLGSQHFRQILGPGFNIEILNREIAINDLIIKSISNCKNRINIQ